MRTCKALFVAATLLLSLVNLSTAQFGTKQITFKPDVFNQSLTTAVAPNVMGYQFVLIKDGKIVTEGANGKARTAADNGGKVLTMTTSTPQNIGSLAKFLSGTAMLNIMEKPAYASPDQGKSLQQRLDRPFLSISPTVWSAKAKEGAKKITFRQLLQHRSGFPNAYNANRSYLGFLQDGFDPARLGVRDYNNFNFAFNGYLIALYDNPPMAAQFDNNISYQKMNEVDGDKYVRGVMGPIMHNLMKERIWDKMTPKFNPTCDSKKDLKTTGAYGYSSKSATSGGQMDSMIEQQGHCGGHGGYFMSARDFANYVAHFSATDLIVDQAGRDAMYKDGMTLNDRVVWTDAWNDSWMNTNFKIPSLVGSNGITDGNRTVLIRFPQNYYLILFTNSSDLNINALYTAGVGAFKAGMQHNF